MDEPVNYQLQPYFYLVTSFRRGPVENRPVLRRVHLRVVLDGEISDAAKHRLKLLLNPDAEASHGNDPGYVLEYPSGRLRRAD